MPTQRWFLLSLGWCSVAIGVVGVFVPVLPTVPFLILATYCFSKSSPRLHRWLVEHPRFGHSIRDWHEHGVIRLRAKRLATATVALGAVFPMHIVPLPSWARWLIAGTLLGALVFIWSRPSVPRRRSGGSSQPTN